MEMSMPGQFMLTPDLPTDQEVHIWRIPLVQDETTRQELERFLSSSERARADRFSEHTARHAFVVARGYVRVILGAYLRVSPARIRLSSNRYGKPYLMPGSNQPDLKFNLSHSHNLALCAVARGHAVGIDVEWLHRDIPFRQIAARFFAPEEMHALFALPPALQQRAFFACWTRKEAYLKARGLGLSLPLAAFEVNVDPETPARLVRPEQSDRRRWSLMDLHAEADYAAALAVEGRPVRDVYRIVSNASDSA